MSDFFIGEWDCAGAHIADRMVREGHEVCWITRHPDRSLWSAQFKGKIYQDIHSKDEFNRILHSNSVENVFFMTADNRERSLYGTQGQSESDFLPIVMEYLKDYQLNSFVLFPPLKQMLCPSIHLQLRRSEIRNIWQRHMGKPIRCLC